MITEDDLTRLLAEAAESAPPPGETPDALVAALVDRSTAAAPVRRIDGRRARAVLAAAAAVLLVVFAVGAVTSTDDDGAPTAAGDDAVESAGAPTTISGAGEDEAEGGGVAVPSPADGRSGDAAGAGEAAGRALADAGAAVAPPAAQDGAKIVKTGSVDLEVAEGSFGRAVERVTAEVVALNGYVAEQTTTQGDDAQSGSIVARVPEGSFEALLTELRTVGEVQSVTSKGTDVTAQHTDLVARLAALTATRDRLSAVLAEADSVTDILMVQDRITAVQAEIESYQGQIRLLEDQAAMATLAITLAEPGAEPLSASEPDDDGGLGGAWDDARRRFGDGLEALVSWSGLAALLLGVGAVALVAARAVWPRARRLLL